MPDILLHLALHIVASLLYAGLGYHFWHTRWRSGGRVLEPRPTHPWEYLAIAVVLLIHGAGLGVALFSDGGLRFSFALAASLMLWLAVLIYWLESFRARMDGMQPLVLSLAALAAVLPALFPLTHEIAYARSLGFRLHFLAAMLAYSLFTLAALHALFMGLLGQNLHRGSIGRQHAELPSILAMETLLFRLIGLAFLLLTLTLISGSFFSERIFGKAFVFDHKSFFASIAWLIFAALLFGRYHYGWRGRIALRWTLAGFLVLLLAYIGSRFVLEVLLGRI